MDTSRSAPVWRSCPSVLLGKELTLVELIIYPWIDTGVIQSFRIRTKTKKKIRVEMTPLITTKPLAHSNSTTTTVRQRNPTLPPNNLKTDCSCPFHRIYVFSDTSMLHKMSTPPSQTTTSVYHQNKASIVFAWGQKNEKGMRESKNWKWCDLQGYSGTVLVKKEKKKQLLRFKDHRMMVLPTTSVLQSSLQQILCFSTKDFYDNLIIGWNNRSRSRKVSYQWQHKLKKLNNTPFRILS